jgi:hypothetical protein
MEMVAVCDCNRKTGKPDKMIKTPSVTMHVNDVCNYCGYYVKYVPVDLANTKFGNYHSNHDQSYDEIDLRKDFLYNYGYPLHIGARK